MDFLPRLAVRFGLLAVFLAGSLGAASAQIAFYQSTPAERAGPPGSVIRAEPMEGAPAGASAWRVLYRSTGLDGQPIAVSGVVVLPPGDPPAGGREVVAWAHPTSGIVSRCAPSLAIFIFQQIQGLRGLVEQGYIVAATDYPGLGTPGPHPYLVGVSEGRAVLDSVRAARALAGAGTSDRYALWGHSQGGQAALYAAGLSAHYAPELHPVGVAVAAPATDLATLMRDDLATAGGRNLTAMTLWSWAQVFGTPIDGIVAPSAMGAVDALSNECIESLYDIFRRRESEGPLAKSFLLVPDLVGLEPFRSLLARNSIGTLPPSLPVFIAQGTADELVRPAVTADYVARLCRTGSKVAFDPLPGVGHGFAARDSANAAVAWIDNRFAGEPPPDDCGKK